MRIDESGVAVKSGHTLAITRAERVRRVLVSQESTLVIVIIGFALAITVMNPVFVSIGNLTNLLTTTVTYFVAACGLTLVIVAGGFDFSVGANFTLGGVSAVWLMALGAPWPLAILLGVGLGGLVGFVNAVIIDRLSVPPIITTLGTFYLVSGMVVLFTGGRDIQVAASGFLTFGRGSLLGVPYMILYGVLIGILFHLVLQRSTFGYNTKAIGGNLSAAVANGISQVRMNTWLYLSGGAIAALAGILYAARTGSGQVAAGGASFTLIAVSAVLIGGTSLFGGVGTIAGTALGALLFAVINNGLAIASVPALYSNIVIGAILVMAVALDSYRRKRALTRLE